MKECVAISAQNAQKVASFACFVYLLSLLFDAFCDDSVPVKCVNASLQAISMLCSAMESSVESVLFLISLFPCRCSQFFRAEKCDALPT